MSFDPLAEYPRLRRFLPWGLWAGGVLAVVVGWENMATEAFFPVQVEAAVVDVRAPCDCVVEAVDVDVGTRTTIEMPLLVLRDLSLDALVASAEASLAVLEAAVVEQGATLDDADFAQEARLAQEIERATVQRVRHEASLEEARAQRETLSPMLARQQNLLGQGLTTVDGQEELGQQARVLDERIKTMTALVDAAAASERNAAERLRAFVRGHRRPRDADKAGDTDGTMGGNRLAEARAEVAAQRVLVSELKAQQAARTLRTIEGVVTDVWAHPGQRVLSGDVLARVMTSASPRLRGYVDPRHGRQVAVGQHLKLRSRDGTPPLRASVTSVAPGLAPLPLALRFHPTTDIRQALRVELRLDGDDTKAALLPGAVFDARFISP